MKKFKKLSFFALLVVAIALNCKITGINVAGFNQPNIVETFKEAGKRIENGGYFFQKQLVEALAVEPEPEPEPEIITTTATISAVGDLMVHTWQMRDAYDKESGEYDFTNDFEMITKYLDQADFRIGNLETVFAGADIGYSDFPMFNTPDTFGQAIAEAGFDLLTTTNNHSLDKKEAGLLRTLDILDGFGIDHVGTYRSQEDRDSFTIKEINGINVAFLSYTYGTNGLPVPKGKDYLINIMNRDLIRADLEAVKALNPDVIIVMPHMGNEYELKPRQIFIDWIDHMFECGADIVLASHPHVLQPMEVKDYTDANGESRKVFVAYSLGNFISSQRTHPRDTGIIVNITLSKTGDERAEIDMVEYIPTWVQFTNQSGMDYVRVLGIKDVLDQYENGIENQLRPKDITRLKTMHKWITDIYVEGGVPLEEMQEIYTFYEREGLEKDIE